MVGIAGVVFGETTPSVTGVVVLGTPSGDFALNVQLDGNAGNFWFAADLLEFLDHAPGTEIRVGDVRLVRQGDGQWRDESPPRPPALSKAPRAVRRVRQETRPWWCFW